MKFFQTLTKEDWPFAHGIMAVVLVIAFAVTLLKLALL